MKHIRYIVMFLVFSIPAGLKAAPVMCPTHVPTVRFSYFQPMLDVRGGCPATVIVEFKFLSRGAKGDATLNLDGDKFRVIEFSLVYFVGQGAVSEAFTTFEQSNDIRGFQASCPHTH